MKDFFEWLGVNEKIGKLFIWILIIMLFLIITNTMLFSMGYYHYIINKENLLKINLYKLFEYILSWIINLCSFYSIIFLIFRISEIKKIYKYSIIYLLTNILINSLLGYIASQIYIVIFILTFCYVYSERKINYIIYGIISIFINIFFQYVSYFYKMQFIDFKNISQINKFIISLDYFLLIFFIILAKETYLKRGDKRIEDL